MELKELIKVLWVMDPLRGGVRAGGGRWVRRAGGGRWATGGGLSRDYLVVVAMCGAGLTLSCRSLPNRTLLILDRDRGLSCETDWYRQSQALEHQETGRVCPRPPGQAACCVGHCRERCKVLLHEPHPML